MEAKNISMYFYIPSVDEFAEQFPQYGKFAKGDGLELFKKIACTETMIFMQVVTIALDLPAVAGVAKNCFVFVMIGKKLEWTNFVKQFIGAVVCTMMEANGFEKTGKRKAVPLKMMTKGVMFRVKL